MKIEKHYFSVSENFNTEMFIMSTDNTSSNFLMDDKDSDERLLWPLASNRQAIPDYNFK